MKDPDVLLEQDFVSAPLVEVDGQVGAEVTYLGKKDRFTATQLVAMLLTKLKQTTAAEIKSPVSDIVLSCPTWYTDAQRRALLDATDIAGLKCLRLINDTTASALGYGITKTDLPASDERPRRVCFIDIGHSNYTCSIVEFRKAELVVKATAWDRHFGGRYFDRAIVDHFAKEFKEKFKIDVNENPKARFRVAAAVEKLKKILSANTSAPLNIESVMNDIDVRGMLKRDELEDLVRPLLDRITVPIEQALADANLQIDDIDSVEMVGGCTRVPALKSAIQSFFNKPLSFTLNQDEAVARGCAFSCAILSPAFRVRDFAVHDLVAYPIDFSWEPSPDIPDEDMSLTVFTKGSLMPSTKILTFYRKHVFDLEAKYAMPELLPGKTAPWIGRFSVKGVKPDSKGDFMICKLKARLNLHGVLNVEAGYWVEDQEEEEPVSEAPKEEGNSDVRRSPPPSEISDLTSPAAKRRKLNVHVSESWVTEEPRPSHELTENYQAMDVDKEAPSDKPKTRKKKLTRKGDLTLSAGTTSMDMATKEQALERENQMFMEDKLVADTENQKNELESFIYELKDKITSTYADFANDDEKAKLAAKLDTVEVRDRWRTGLS